MTASPPPQSLPTVEGLVVATGGPLLMTDDTGGLVAVDPASQPAVSVTAAAGDIVAIDAQGGAQALEGSTSPSTWSRVPLPVARVGLLRFLALAPSNAELAVVDGLPQGSSFTVTIIELGTARTRVITAGRGLNGPPGWLGPGAIALDVIRDDGGSGIATISVADGVLHDERGPGTVLVASSDGSRVAVDDPTTGDALVGDVAAWRAGGAALERIHGPPGAGIERLALSADGTLLAVARRTDAGGSIELLVRDAGGWRSVQTLTTAGDGPIAIAWRR